MPTGIVRTLVSGAPAPERQIASTVDAPVPSVPLAETARVGSPAVLPHEAQRTPDLFAELPDSVLGVTAEHRGRYVQESGGELGRGGIGRVFVAADRHLGRDVAVKELLFEHEEPSSGAALQTLARFLREARITGKLEHPNIVPVHELGRRADGTLYYTMRVVRGRTLSQALAETHTVGERLALIDHFIGLCQAIAYAHSRGVVHRDIKSDNVMIGEFGETVVLDWGMAKVISASANEVIGHLPAESARQDLEPEGMDLTIQGTLCGTPTHMSPEQARGATDEVDERSDVWALGVVLYTMLTGSTPFDARTLPELIAKIRSGVHPAPRTIDPAVPPELSAIAERALQRDPDQRYPSARELLRDVEAYRSGARVGAYEYSTFDLLRRFLERHRTAVVASLVGLLVALVLAVVSYARLATARDRALLAERNATTNERQARESERAAKESLSEVLVEKAEQALAEGDRTAAELLAAEALRLGERADARGLVVAAERASRPEPELTLPDFAGCARYALNLSAGLLVCAHGEAIDLYDVRSGAPRAASLPGGRVTALELSTDGTHLLSVEADGRLSLFDLRNGAERILERRIDPVASAAISGNGRLVAWSERRGAVVLMDTALPVNEKRFVVKQGVSALSFSPDATTIAVGGVLGTVTLWDFATDRARVLAGHTGTVREVAFSPQNRYLATAAVDHTIRVWDTRDGSSVSSPLVHAGVVSSLSWAGVTPLLAYGSEDGTFHVLDLRDPTQSSEVRFHGATIERVALSADGLELASASRERGLELWSLASMKTPSALVGHGNVLSFEFAGAHQLVSAGLGSEGVCIFDLDAGVCETRLPAGIDRVRSVAVSNDETRLALAGSSSRVMLWDLKARLPLHVFDSPSDEVRAVAFSPDGRQLALGGLDHVLRVVDPASLVPIVEFDDGAAIQTVVFSPVNDTVITGDRDGLLSVWDVRQKRRSLRWKAHEDWLLSIAVSPDGRTVATGGADRHVKLWNASDGAPIADLGAHENRVLSVSFSLDGRLVASGSEDKTVRLWDVDARREAAVLGGHTAAVRAVRFAPGRTMLASAGDDGTIRLWQLTALHEAGEVVRDRVRARYGVALAGTRVVRTRAR